MSLREYLDEFSLLGSFPTSLSGYGLSPQRHALELGAMGASPNAAADDEKSVLGPKPTASSLKLGTERWQQLTPYRIKDLQTYLNALEAKAGTSGKLDQQTKNAWNTYVRVFKETRPELVAATGGWDSGNWVWMNKIAFDGTGTGLSLKERGIKARAAKPTASTASKPAARPQTTSKPAPSQKPASAPSGMRKVKTSEVQVILTMLGAPKERLSDNKFGSTTQGEWEKAAKARGLVPTITGGKAAQQVTVNGATFDALVDAAKSAKNRTPPAPPEPIAKGNIVINTSEAQQLLINLGAPKARMTDGIYGSTTAANWASSATKRKLDPYMVKHTDDGKQVTVREGTYYRIKADADAKVPPQPTTGVAAPPPGGSLWSLPPASISVITVDELGAVLGRIANAKTDASTRLDVLYADIAKKNGIDPRIEAEPNTRATYVASAPRVAVIKATWVKLQELSDKAAPKTPAPVAPKSEMEAALAAIKKGSTASIPASTIRQGLNALIADGRIRHAEFPKGDWEDGLRDYVLDALEIKKDPARNQWATALSVGTLVSKDKKTVKLPPKGVDFFKAAAAKLAQAKKDAQTVLAGYTKVNTADIIARINALNISTTKFDKNGDARVLGDAIQTFFENTKTKAPSGDYLRQVGKDVLVRNEILTALANAVKLADERSDATATYRKNMVTNALKEASASVTIDQLQQAIMHTALRKQGGANQKEYESVKNTGAFDAPTRTAFTAVAQTATFGPALLQFEKLAKAQLGPNFKTQVVQELKTKVWGEYLEKALTKQGSTLSIKTLPAIAKQITDAAKLYQQNTTADKRQQDKVKAQEAALSDAVRKSTAIVSLFDVQQGLLQMVAKKQVKNTGIKITGFGGDKATREGLFQVASYIFPEGYAVPETMWMAYLKKVGVSVLSANDVKADWSGKTNYIALPPSLADILSKRAGEYMALKGTPVGASSLAPLPRDNQELRLRFGEPSVVTAQRPAAKEDKVVFTPQETTSSQSAATSSTSGGGAGGSSAGGSASVTGPQTNITGPTLAPVFNITMPNAPPVMQTQQTSPVYTMPTSGEGPLLPDSTAPQPAFEPPTGATATAPTSAADAAAGAAQPETPPVTEAGVVPTSGGAGWLWLLGAAGAAAYALSKDDKDKNKKNQWAKPSSRRGAIPRRGATQKRYSTR